MHGIICYWNWNAKKGLESKVWHLAESFAIDADGHCLTTPSTGGGARQEWYKWMNKVDEDNDDYLDHIPIMGRAVTLWTFEHGVTLLDVHPPEWADFLSPSFYEELCKLENWYSLLQRGYDLYIGTATEARKYVHAADKKHKK